jgi:hypothetical protein
MKLCEAISVNPSGKFKFMVLKCMDFILQSEDICEGKEFIPGALTNIQDVQIAILVQL